MKETQRAVRSGFHPVEEHRRPPAGSDVIVAGGHDRAAWGGDRKRHTRIFPLGEGIVAWRFIDDVYGPIVAATAETAPSPSSESAAETDRIDRPRAQNQMAEGRQRIADLGAIDKAPFTEVGQPGSGHEEPDKGIGTFVWIT